MLIIFMSHDLIFFPFSFQKGFDGTNSPAVKCSWIPGIQDNSNSSRRQTRQIILQRQQKIRHFPLAEQKTRQMEVPLEST